MFTFIFSCRKKKWTWQFDAEPIDAMCTCKDGEFKSRMVFFYGKLKQPLCYVCLIKTNYIWKTGRAWYTERPKKGIFGVTGICQNWNLSEFIFTQNWNLSELEFVRIGICQNWYLSELEFVRNAICQNWKLSKLEFVRIRICQNSFLLKIGICQNWNLSELEFVRVGICQNWNLSELEFVRIGICQNWNMSELAMISFGAKNAM